MIKKDCITELKKVHFSDLHGSGLSIVKGIGDKLMSSILIQAKTTYKTTTKTTGIKKFVIQLHY
ncbi:hypothetical protein GCM10022292_13090 [Winogradskyella damuponensis]|uniref:ATP-binding protein n=1 Tax=Winogradskyella damuponensis TaxID=943939 RepID=A0ABP8CRE5_9FLAO